MARNNISLDERRIHASMYFRICLDELEGLRDFIGNIALPPEQGHCLMRESEIKDKQLFHEFWQKTHESITRLICGEVYDLAHLELCLEKKKVIDSVSERGLHTWIASLPNPVTERTMDKFVREKVADLYMEYVDDFFNAALALETDHRIIPPDGRRKATKTVTRVFADVDTVMEVATGDACHVAQQILKAYRNGCSAQEIETGFQFWCERQSKEKFEDFFAGDIPRYIRQRAPDTGIGLG